MLHEAHHSPKRPGKYTHEQLLAVSARLLAGESYASIGKDLGMTAGEVTNIFRGITKGAEAAMAEEIDRATREKLWYSQYKRTSVNV